MKIKFKKVLAHMLGILVVQMAGKGKQKKEYKELSFPLEFSMHLPLTYFDRYSQANPL